MMPITFPYANGLRLESIYGKMYIFGPFSIFGKIERLGTGATNYQKPTN
jgi:hypothetical protein